MVALVLAVTEAAVAVKFTVDVVAVTDAGILSAALLLDIVITVPPAGMVPESARVHEMGPGPVIEFDAQLNEFRAAAGGGGADPEESVSVNEADPP